MLIFIDIKRKQISGYEISFKVESGSINFELFCQISECKV